MSGSTISPIRVALADTGFLLAVMDRRSPQHHEALALYDKFPGEILVPTVLLAELAYMLHRVGGAELVIRSMRAIRGSQIRLVDLIDDDYDRALAILEKYADTRIDFVDACIMALAERLTITRILTYDRRDFGLFQPSHTPHFDLLP